MVEEKKEEPEEPEEPAKPEAITKEPELETEPVSKGPEDAVSPTFSHMACSQQYDKLREAVVLALQHLDDPQVVGRILRKALGEEHDGD